MISTTTKFKRDHHFRAALFHPDSFKHQGRANLNQLLALLQTMPAGQLVLDPMAGTGSSLIYTDYGSPVICGELEPHWAAVCRANHQTMAVLRLFSASTPALCCQWNAARLPLVSNSVPNIVFSPPYWDMLSDWHITSNNLQAGGHETYGIAYGLNPANIGNVHIYEDYLRAMAAVYRECYRVLQPGGLMALILKDRIHKQRRVPIVNDTTTLAVALGFSLIGHIDRQVTNSYHRNVYQQKFPNAPVVDNEPMLIFTKLKAIKHPGPSLTKIALIQAPKPDSAPSCQLFIKAHTYAERRGIKIFVIDETGLLLRCFKLGTPNLKSFRRRKEYAFNILADLVTKYGFTTGTTIEFHGSMDYGQYIMQRGKTLGLVVTNPTRGLNLGQKLKWYTERLA